MMMSNETSPVGISVKILLEPGIAGSIIGKGGSAITDLTEISGARIKVSNLNDCYPGTADQVLFISGGEDEVDSAQELVWHRIAQHMVWKTCGSVGQNSFDPKATLDSIRRGDITRGHAVTGRILIPSEACGAVIGTNGSTIRTMSEETGVRLQLSPKDDPVSLATHERIVTLVGEVEDCIQCTANIIKKMQEDTGAVYANKTPSYTFYHSSLGLPMVGDHSPRGSSGRSSQQAQLSNKHGGGNQTSFVPPLPPGMTVVSAVTTLTLAVPDNSAGQIIGKKGAAISDMQARSGASITVSVRDNSDVNHDQSTGQRTILIVGSPDEAQAALKLVAQKLWVSVDPTDDNMPTSKKNSFSKAREPAQGRT